MLSAPLWCVLPGCASAPPDATAERRAYEEELQKERQAHEATVANLSRERDLARDEAHVSERELQRLTRELDASRLTSVSHKASLDAALELIARKNTELNALKKGEGAAPTEGGALSASQAVPLLLAKDRQIKALRSELARLRSGDAKPKDKALDGIVTRADLALDVPVARVDGEPVTRRDFVEFLYRDLGAPELLDLFLNRYLVVREARRHGLEVPTVDTELWVTQQIMLHNQQVGGEEKLAEKLKEKGFTREAWEARLRYQAEPALMLKRLVELNRRTPEGREAFERLVRRAYDETYTPRVSARHVLIRCIEGSSPASVQAAERKAEAAYRQLQGGTGFDQVAKFYSDDKDSRLTGGRLGTFDRNKYVELPRLNAAFFTLPAGEVSRPVRSRAGFHLVLVDEKLPPAKPFDERTKSAIVARLEGEAPQREEVDALVLKLRSRAKIETALVFD
ncbi:MAG: peptidylprolyl isomerase [Planctomycetota bacterium]